MSVDGRRREPAAPDSTSTAPRAQTEGRARRRHGGTGVRGDPVAQLRHAEVEDLEAVVPSDEKVFGLQIPVDDAFVMGGDQALSDLPGQIDGPMNRERSGRDPLAQRL